MKYASFAILASVILSAFVFGPSEGLNATYGSVNAFDNLLYREYVLAKGQFLRVIRRDVVYPPLGYTNQRTITAVRAIDQAKGGNGGYATLTRGGPGTRNVTLHLQSLRSHGLNFTVEVYGR